MKSFTFGCSVRHVSCRVRLLNWVFIAQRALYVKHGTHLICLGRVPGEH